MGNNASDLSGDESEIEEISWMEDSARDSEESVSDDLQDESTSDEEDEDDDSVPTKEGEETPLLDPRSPRPCRNKSSKPCAADRKLPFVCPSPESHDSEQSTPLLKTKPSEKILGDSQVDAHHFDTTPGCKLGESDDPCTPKSSPHPSLKPSSETPTTNKI